MPALAFVDLYSDTPIWNRAGYCQSRVQVQTLDRTAGELAADDGTFAQSAVFDARSAYKNQCSVYIIPDTGNAVYNVWAIFEMDANGVPDMTKAKKWFTSNTTVSNPNVGLVALSDAIPFFFVGLVASTTTANSVKIIVSTKV